MLQELQLEHESSRNTERPTFQLGDRCVSHPGSEEVAGALNVEPGDISGCSPGDRVPIVGNATMRRRCRSSWRGRADPVV